jgi:hypothetical protein
LSPQPPTFVTPRGMTLQTRGAIARRTACHAGLHRPTPCVSRSINDQLEPGQQSSSCQMRLPWLYG